MRNKFILLLILTLSFLCMGGQSSIPKGLLALITQLETDPTIRWGFNEIKEHHYIDKSILFEDMHVGSPVCIYNVNNEQLELSADLPVLSYIYDTKAYLIPVYAKGKCIRVLRARAQHDKWIFCMSSGDSKSIAWDKFMKAWHEATSPTPIMIDWDPIELIHFPEIDSSNLIYLMGSDEKNPNFNDFESSKKNIKRMRNQLIKNKKNIAENPCLYDPSNCSEGVKHE